MPGPPPPPPPPMPPMGRGAGGPPPPPPMPGMKAPGAKPPSGAGRGALLSDINKGARLKKVTQVNDRSAPQVGKVSDGPSGPPIGGAPPVPGMGRPPAPPSGLAPPVPGNRARSNSDTGSGDTGVPSAPQLGGLFAGVGMPKLRKAGGVKTGAESNSPYLSDPETTSRASAPRAPKPPTAAAPRPPGAPPGAPPPLPTARPPPNPSIAALRNNLRPSSIASTHSLPDFSSKPKPPPPIGKKPPIPPPTSRKPSGFAPPPPASPARPPPVPGNAPPAPPPPPPSVSTPSAPPPPPPAATPPAPPPPPPSSAPRLPPVRSTPPPPPPNRSQEEDDDDYDPYRYDNTPPRPPAAPAPPPPKAPANGHQASLAEQLARNVLGRASPAAPPPPPPASTPPSAPSAPAPPPPPTSPPARTMSQPPIRSMLDPSSYTLTNGGSGVKSGPTSPGMLSPGQKGKIIPIHDLRWRFQDEGQFPKPRDFSNGPKRYRAGRGSSVPLDLTAFE